MNVIDVVNRLTAPLRTKVSNMIVRAVLESADDSTKIQLVKLHVGTVGDSKVIRSDVERIQNYGFSSVPRKPSDAGAAEACVVFLGGRGDHGLVIAVDDRRYRLVGLEEGETAIYTDEGDKVVIKRGGTVEVTASTKVHLVTPLVECSQDMKITGKLHVVSDVTLDAKIDVSGKGTFSGDVDAGGTVTATTEVIGGGKHLSTHTHSGSPLTLAGGVCSVGGVSGGPGQVSGSTAAPS